jgi:hypothetical protein
MNINGLAGSAAAGLAGGPSGSQFASPIGRDRLVRQETALGVVREIVPPEMHIALQLFPFMEVATDDVIFQYARGITDGLAPARAEDAESELAQKDDIFGGEARASVIDWAVKDHYVASDVSRYRDWLSIQEVMRDSNELALTVNSMTSEFNVKMARDTMRRRRKLDNRIEDLGMTSLSTGVYAYNDGKIKFTVDWGRPSAQQAMAPAANPLGMGAFGSAWNTTPNNTSDPIGDITKIQQYAWNVYGIRITRALISRQALSNILNSAFFAQRTGLVLNPGATPLMGDPRYLVDGWGPNAAQAIVEQQTGLTFTEYDSVYRTRAVGATTFTLNRFVPENRVIFLPEESDINDFDETGLGLGRFLTSPHPAGLWTPGFYEWEKDFGVDPWGLDMGTGIKTFPVFPHMEYTFTYDVY